MGCGGRRKSGRPVRLVHSVKLDDVQPIQGAMDTAGFRGGDSVRECKPYGESLGDVCSVVMKDRFDLVLAEGGFPGFGDREFLAW